MTRLLSTCHRSEEADASLTLVLALACLAVFRAGRRAGRASAEGVLDGHMGAEPEPRQRGAHRSELERQDHHRNAQPRNRQYAHQERHAQSRRGGWCASRPTARTGQETWSRTSSRARLRISACPTVPSLERGRVRKRTAPSRSADSRTEPRQRLFFAEERASPMMAGTVERMIFHPSLTRLATAVRACWR